ncbi:hypothetical protein U724_29315 [Pseudomonas chlororaphis subsp. aurantiaca PB-St2]|nr:hypothetical protein U724_29315 [Pseudomonas chlororaphis subsp. aurantiaca PB-St2]
MFRFCEDFVLERSLATLRSGYNGNSGYGSTAIL